MINAGVSFKIGSGGQKNHVSTSRVAMAKEIKSLQQENTDLKNQVSMMQVQIQALLKATGIDPAALAAPEAVETVQPLTRVDVVEKDKDGNPTIERVRVNKE